MIKLNKPKFWDKNNISLFSILLLPLSLVTLILIFFKRLFTKVKSFNIPIICIGNLYIGGTGKTPVSVYLAKELKKLGKKTAILRKFYSSHKDEYGEIKNEFKDLIINKNRINGLIDAEKAEFETVIMDDGLQDYRIKKDIKIVCFHENQLIGNGLIIPAGPLRESLKALRNVDIVLINGEKNDKFEKKILNYNQDLEFFYFRYNPLNINEFKNHNLLAIAGIGNPENFFKLIEQNNLKIQKKIIFPDHYNFNENEILKIIDFANERKYKLIMTEKDYFKINKFQIKDINYLKVTLEIFEKEKFFKKIMKLYD